MTECDVAQICAVRMLTHSFDAVDAIFYKLMTVQPPPVRRQSECLVDVVLKGSPEADNMMSHTNLQFIPLHIIRIHHKRCLVYFLDAFLQLPLLLFNCCFSKGQKIVSAMDFGKYFCPKAYLYDYFAEDVINSFLFGLFYTMEHFIDGRLVHLVLPQL